MLVDEELLEVPLDAFEAQHAGLLVLEVLVHGVRVVAVDVHLFHDGERHAVVELAELADLLVRAALLVAELVAGEPDDLEALVVVALVELLELLVLRREAALGRDVDDEHHLAFQLLEGEGLAGAVEGCEVVEFAHGAGVWCAGVRCAMLSGNDLRKRSDYSDI